MGGLQVAERSSLDRLKALDILPNVSSQLAEANALCTHGARADMIAKWLLEKIKTSQEHKTAPPVWHTLLSAFRLLSPERLASLLGSSHFFSILDSTLESKDCTASLLQAIADVVAFLFEVSAISTGTAIQAALSLPAAKLAPLIGHWMQAIGQVSLSEELHSGEFLAILNPPFKLWDVRKHSNDENTLFAKHCLSSAAVLLSLLPSQSDTVLLKRKSLHGETEHHNGDVKQMLEALLAGHIFLPARTAFFASYENPVTHKGSMSASKHQNLTVVEILDPLKESIHSDSRAQTANLPALPQLLDIALRSVATPTLRHRVKERPWFEAVFKALHECNKTADRELVSNDVLIDMLKTIKQRVSLSTELLMNIFLIHSNLENGNESAKSTLPIKCIQWELIAQLVELDAGLFCDSSVAEKLFGSMTKANADMQQFDDQDQKDYETEQSHASEVARHLWLDRIVVPVMNAFTQNRDFGTFLHLWRSNLIQDRENQKWSIWTHLERGVEAIIQDSLTELEITTLVNDESSKIFSALNEDIRPPSTEPKKNTDGDVTIEADVKDIGTLDNLPMHLAPSIVILDAILGGLTSETLLVQIAPKCEILFKELIEARKTLYEKGVRSDYLFCIGLTSRVWSLLLKVFEIWFPAWAATQSDGKVVSERARQWMSHGGYRVLPNGFISEPCPSSRTIRDAEYFCWRMELLFVPYKQHLDEDYWMKRCLNVESMANNVVPADSRAFLEYTSMIEAFDKGKAAYWLVHEYCLDWIRQNLNHLIAKRSINALRALAAATIKVKQTKMIDTFLEYLCRLPEKEGDSYETSFDKKMVHVMIDVVSESLADLLDRDAREKMLDDLSSESFRRIASSDELIQQKQLALTIKLLQKPSASAKLSIVTATIWQLGRTEFGGYSDPNSTFGPPSRTTIALLEELARLLLKHLLAAQHQEISRSLLELHSEHVEQVLKQLCTSPWSSNSLTAFALCKSIIQGFELGSKPDLATKLPHRNIETMSLVLDACTTFLNQLLQSERHASSSEVPVDPITALSIDVVSDVLNEAMRICSAMLTGSINDAASRVMTTISALLPADERVPLGQSCFTAAVVRCYAVASKYVSSYQSSNLTNAAMLALSNRPSPQDIEILVNCYSDHLKTLDGASRVKLLDLHSEPKAVSLKSHLLLLQSCISAVNKEDFALADSINPYQLLPRLLDIASAGHGLLVHQRITACIITVLKDKPFLTNQHNIEATLVTITKLLDTRIGLSIVFTDVCRIISTLLSSHRTRLHGRFHLMNQVFQTLISVLFQDSRMRQHSKDTPGKALNHTHAHALSRILVLFCEPLNLHSHSRTSRLVDESRKKQAYVGQYVQHILHHYCAQVLQGPLGEGVKDALTPGIWAMIDAIRTAGEDGMKSLSASMNNNERAILRGVYEDWKRFGKWRGG